MNFFKRALVVLTVLLGTTSHAGASTLPFFQKWDDHYDRAVVLVEGALKQKAPREASQWSEAINLLEEAIALKSDPQTGRFGMIIGRRKAYFPYFYLGVACLKSGQLERSRQSFAKARQFGAIAEDKDLAPQLSRYEALLDYQTGSAALERDQLAEALESFERADKGALPADLQTDLDRQIETLKQRITATKRSFQQHVSTAQTHLEADRFDSALRELSEARQVDPGEYERQGLGKLKQQAETALVQRLLTEIKESHDRGLQGEAQAKLKQALAIAPGRPEVLQTLRQIVGDYPALKQNGDTAYSDGDWAAACGYYQKALLFFDRNARRDRLSLRVESAIRSLLKESVGQLTMGSVEEAVNSLEKAVEQGVDDVRVHVYLGVAYAKQAFDSTEPDQLRKLRGQAIEQFRRAKNQDPSYQLPPRIVSPLIVELFENAGGG